MALELIVVTPEGQAFAQEVEYVVLPGVEGEFAVLESHQKFLTPLQPGAMEVKLSDGSSEWAALSDGFAEVTGEQVVVLVSECYKAHEIDAEHARVTHEEIEQKLSALQNETEQADHLAELEAARVRLSVQLDVSTRLHQ